MIQLVLQNIFRFIVLVLVQVYLLDNIQFIGYVNPMIYVLFILSLPARMNRSAMLLLAFALGLTIDMFSDTMGLHTFATVLMAFLRTPIIRIFVSLDEGANPAPSFSTFGVSTYIKYVISMVFVHHTVLFSMESFSLFNLHLLIPKIFISLTVTVLIIFGIQSVGK